MSCLELTGVFPICFVTIQTTFSLFYPLNIVVMCNNCTVIYSLMPWWFYITQYLELSWWGFCSMYEVWFSILFYFHEIGHSTSLSNIADKTGTCSTCIKTWKSSDAFVSNKRRSGSDKLTMCMNITIWGNLMPSMEISLNPRNSLWVLGNRKNFKQQLICRHKLQPHQHHFAFHVMQCSYNM